MLLAWQKLRKPSMGGEKLDKGWMSNNDIGEQVTKRKRNRKIATVDGFHTHNS
jgi:hypothetical protein